MFWTGGGALKPPNGLLCRATSVFALITTYHVNYDKVLTADQLSRNDQQCVLPAHGHSEFNEASPGQTTAVILADNSLHSLSELLRGHTSRGPS